ncbi:trypsin-like peptidase domain-containing protein [Mesorhizobium sp. WSM4306]|uniref:trypsin-like serine peptidase n=1 Tax=Mesorhizobium sp. WSM4306 TaxID=2589885 RepID=UPI00115E2D59|nr:trypsin-like peptidase domain-containing protein [Mesorhizobium sp. WSM4306]TRC99700.1 trypsin-like peptidase domain-containing protein [Mesorhizobium sp. WSM4306]
MARYDQDAVERLRSTFARRLVKARPGVGLESMESAGASAEGGGDAVLSPEALLARWEVSRDFLREFIARELGDDAKLVEGAERALRNGREGLELIGGKTSTTTASPRQVAAGLEVVVRTDGSRPAFIIRDDDIVKDSSPSGSWTDLLTDVTRLSDIRKVLGSVGRIDMVHPGAPFAGTGWLIGKDLLVTNRHVAQLFVDFESGGAIMPGREPHVDFGHELNGAKSRNRRPIIELVFCGATPIPNTGLNHTLLDLAVFRLGGSAAAEQMPLKVGLGEQLANPQTEIIIIGYPAKPGSDDILGTVTETDRVLKLLFNKLWGYKRLAPGEVMNSSEGIRTVSHDASTLGGNSGSVVMGIDTLPLVTGLHYGGFWGGERANWGHVVENVLTEKGLGGLQYETLHELSKAEGVELVAAEDL